MIKTTDLQHPKPIFNTTRFLYYVPPRRPHNAPKTKRAPAAPGLAVHLIRPPALATGARDLEREFLRLDAEQRATVSELLGRLDASIAASTALAEDMSGTCKVHPISSRGRFSHAN